MINNNQIEQIKQFLHNEIIERRDYSASRMCEEVLKFIEQMGKTNIWVVTAHRTTASEHSYVVGLYEDFEDAKKAANIEQYNRGGKYDMDINGYILNQLPEEYIDDEDEI